MTSGVATSRSMFSAPSREIFRYLVDFLYSFQTPGSRIVSLHTNNRTSKDWPNSPRSSLRLPSFHSLYPSAEVYPKRMQELWVFVPFCSKMKCQHKSRSSWNTWCVNDVSRLSLGSCQRTLAKMRTGRVISHVPSRVWPVTLQWFSTVQCARKRWELADVFLSAEVNGSGTYFSNGTIKCPIFLWKSLRS